MKKLIVVSCNFENAPKNSGTTTVMQYQCLLVPLIQEILFFFWWHSSPQQAKTSSLLRLHDHTQAHHAQQDSSVRVISSSHRPQPDNTQHSKRTDIHAPWRDSNPQFQQTSVHRPTPQTAWPLGSDKKNTFLRKRHEGSNRFKLIHILFIVKQTKRC